MTTYVAKNYFIISVNYVLSLDCIDNTKRIIDNTERSIEYNCKFHIIMDY